MTPPQDRNSERLLGELSANVAALGREIKRDRELGDTRHEENTDKLDQVLGLKPMVEAHDAWIKGPGADLARMASEARGGYKVATWVKGVFLMLGGASIYKAAIAALAALAK